MQAIKQIITDLFYFEGYSALAYPDMPYSSMINCQIYYKGFDKKTFLGNNLFSNKE